MEEKVFPLMRVIAVPLFLTLAIAIRRLPFQYAACPSGALFDLLLFKLDPVV